MGECTEGRRACLACLINRETLGDHDARCWLFYPVVLRHMLTLIPSHLQVESDAIDIECMFIVDEFCPYVQEAPDAGLILGLRPGDALVPVQSGEAHDVRELYPHDPWRAETRDRFHG